MQPESWVVVTFSIGGQNKKQKIFLEVQFFAEL